MPGHDPAATPAVPGRVDPPCARCSPGAGQGRRQRGAGRIWRVALAAMLLAAPACPAVPESAEQLLQRADQIRTTDNTQFLALLRQLDAQANRLSPDQRDWLAYHKGWQAGLEGRLPQAVAALTAVMQRTHDPILRARARISLLNDQFNAGQFVNAYKNLGVLLDRLPQIADPKVRLYALLVAADLYNQAGQYELALDLSERVLATDASDVAICQASSTLADNLHYTGKLREDDPRIRKGLDACERIGDPIYANGIRLSLAQTQLDVGNAAAALRPLEAHEAEVVASHSSAMLSIIQATMAQCYLQLGDLAKASRYAHSAINAANQQAHSRATVNAWKVLYEVARRQGDDRQALAALERYDAAGEVYRNDVSARALAYQQVHQQVQARKAEIDRLSEQNQMLQLRREVDAKNLLAVRLGIALLLVLLGSLGLYALRTRRSQLKFQKLARRDGLTGICNRQYFIEQAEQELAYCRKSLRDACLVAIDLDHFKQINDNHGHAAGDDALKRAVAAVQAQLRSVDIFGRLGGEEFGILLPDCVPARAADIAEAMRAQVAALHGSADGPEFPLTASFGIASARAAGYDLTALLAHADDALYQAKRSGRNRVVLHGAAAASAGPPPGVAERRVG